MQRFFSYVATVLLVASCASSQASSTKKPEAKVSSGSSASFDAWLKDFKADARQQGISQATLDDLFAEAEYIERVIELDRKQPESTVTFDDYLAKVVNDTRVNNGAAHLAENLPLLKEISKKYGVQPEFIVALWGVETSYGNNMGSFSVPHALATLAYDGRRSDYFRGELIKSLQIIEAGHIGGWEMIGSWAGAMGQCQFMPSSFQSFAEDYDGDGKRDIWSTQADVFASIANYLSSSGWEGDEGWGMPVNLPTGFNATLADIKQERSIDEWKKLGVRAVGGGDLPGKPETGSVIFVGQGDDARPYLIYGNYKVLLKWNRSRYFATAVSLLAEQIKQEGI